MNRSLSLTVLTVAAVAPPVAAPWLAVAGASTVATAAATTKKARVVTGPSANMRWGPVRVRITVKGRRITNVTATAPTERPKSRSINQRALPILRQEALRAQSARIFVVSGATLTSDAYGSSLQAAITKAHV
ncbi:MAG: hypothetical protein QOD69_2930 [Solirubrobacteraceae bacterium]|jgi:uncharacterized protein with FMN-binding domain|nr:hypothetical protein [Solirubrobacteraceae bacterium]